MVSEIARQEIVAVFLIVGYVELERCELHAALGRYALAGRLLLRSHHLELELAKLHVGSDTKEAAGSLDERGVGWEGYVARLHELDDLVLLAIILQLHVLRIIVEGGIGVIVQVHVHLVAHLTVHVEVDFLVKVHHRGLAVADRERWVVDALLVDAKLDFSRTLGLDTDTARTKDFLCWSQVEVHVREVKLLLAFLLVYLIVLLAEVGIALLHLAPGHILLWCHHDRSREPGIAHTVAHDVAVQGIIIHHLILQVVRTAQIERTLVEITQRIRLRLLDLPTRMQQRVRNGILIHLQRLGIDRDDILLIILRIRHGKGIAEGRNHQPSQ